MRTKICNSYFIFYYQNIAVFLIRPVMERHAAGCAHASEVAKLRSQSFAKRRQRHIQAKVRSTVQHRYRNKNSLTSAGFPTI